MKSDAKDFQIERYKYILQQLHTLNENVYKYITLFQTLATAIIGGGVYIFINWKQINLDPIIARLSIQWLMNLLLVLTLFFVLLMLATIFSWIDYRNEEVQLLDKAVQVNFRTRPKLRNFWRWIETYIIIFVVIIAGVLYFFVQTQILPSIQ